MTLQLAAIGGGQEIPVGADGTDVSLYKQDDSITGKSCFVYERYVFKTSPTEDGSDDIIAFKRDRAAGHEENCADGKARPLMTVPADDFNFFFGLTGDKFLVDSGTSAGERGLAVVSLILKKKIYATSYIGDVKVVGNAVVYDQPSDRKGSLKNCPEYRKWRKIGGGEGWVQPTRLDLTTRQTTSNGKLKCVYLE